MAGLNELEKLNEEPRSTIEWLALFSHEEQDKIMNAVRRHQPSQLYPILSNLDVNPYPFGKAALISFCAKVKANNGFTTIG